MGHFPKRPKEISYGQPGWLPAVTGLGCPIALRLPSGFPEGILKVHLKVPMKVPYSSPDRAVRWSPDDKTPKREIEMGAH